MKKILSSIIVLAGILLITSSAHALVANTAANVDVQVSGITTSSTSANIDTNIDANVNTGSSASVDAYSNSMTSSDSSVSNVDTSSDTKVSVSYKRPARLLGFIKVYVTEKATVSAESDVSVTKSWWSFLATSDTKTEEFSSAIKSRVGANASANASGSAELSASAKAKILSDINAAAQATYSGSAKASY